MPMTPEEYQRWLAGGPPPAPDPTADPAAEVAKYVQAFGGNGQGAAPAMADTSLEGISPFQKTMLNAVGVINKAMPMVFPAWPMLVKNLEDRFPPQPGGFSITGHMIPPAAPAAPAMSWDFNTPGLQPGAASTAGPRDAASFIFGPESGGDPNAKSGSSSASGLGQFIDKTWMDKDLRARAGYGYVSDQAWAASKKDPDFQRKMVNAYAARNSEEWVASMKRPPTPGELYGMHFLDGPNFIRLTQVAGTKPDTSAAAMFPDAAKANPTIFFNNGQPRSAAEVYKVLTGKVDSTDPFVMPALQKLDPNALANRIPLPNAPRAVTLPTPPSSPDMPARPQAEQTDVPAIIAQLQAFAPKPFDQTGANSDRLSQVLGGLAHGAASVDARQGAGAVLAAIGAGGQAAANQWTQNTKLDKENHDDAVRLFNLSLATKGIDLEAQNRAVRGANAERTWTDQRDHLLNNFQNQNTQWETQTKQFLMNDQNLRQYDQDIYQAKVNRARVAIGAIESNANMTNEQVTGQAGLDLKKFLFEDEKSTRPLSASLERQVGSIAGSVGIDPTEAFRTKNAAQMNALQGAAYIAARNKTGAINSLGRELVMSGRLDLIPDKKKAAELTTLAKHDPELAAAAAGRLLNQGEVAAPGSSLQWARTMAAQGLPMGQMMTLYTQTKQATTPGAGPAIPPATGPLMSQANR